MKAPYPVTIRFSNWWTSALLVTASILSLRAGTNVMLTDVPDYTWYAGCFGTASGNLMGYWDRHGMPNFYTGPTAGGVAPLDSDGPNVGIRSLWASKAGFDGRPTNQFGHIDDYWQYYLDDGSDSYESTAADPYRTAGRAEHAPDCLGDFIGLSQNKWTNLNGECDGNIDAFSFVFWDPTGARRENYTPPGFSGPIYPDIPAGLRAWTHSRGSEADVFSQLADFNPSVPPGQGFTFEDLKAEINAGYPVLLYLQDSSQLSRSLPGMTRANPEMHGMLAYGYYEADSGLQYVRYKTSWGTSGDNSLSKWTAQFWQASLPVRGVIGFHPRPRITSVTHDASGLIIQWEGPASVLTDLASHTTTPLDWYVVERANQWDPSNFEPVTDPTSGNQASIPDCCGAEARFFRVRLMPPASQSP